ncbi:MAG: trypsin-like serine protease, partial [Proteobacteria bacterium]|nr:trypsin-like serine protease [Pseudomonadota bacterium]
MTRLAQTRRIRSLVLGGLLSLAAISCGSAHPEQSETSVYGGTKAPASSWSNVVAITQKEAGIFCSGTAISPKIVITAAHCANVYDVSELSVYVGAGAEGGAVAGQYAVSKFEASPKYGSEDGAYDI